jgi:hypothetical protein
MSQPSKPFIKARPPSTAPEEARSVVSAAELTTYAVAAGMTVPAERAAYLAHACAGNPALRERIEQRLAERTPVPVPGHELQRMTESTVNVPQNQPAAMALVPMSASQLAAITAQRSNTFPWIAATSLAVAVGALGVLLISEKGARQYAETAGQQAGQRADAAVQDAAAARAAAERERENARQFRTVADEQRQRAETATRQAALARAEEADRQRIAGEAAASQDASGTALTKAALAEAGQEREALRAAQKETNIAFAETLARLAGAQIDGSRFAEAESSARRSLDLRTAHGVTGWPLVESRVLLGAALFQKNADADAGHELSAAASAIEELGAPASEADRARLSLAAKRIVQFYNATGRRKEGSEWKRKFDDLARPQ